jgi:hypothetical protein
MKQINNNYEVERAYDKRVDGTCLQGEVNIDYKTLVLLFGKPETFSGDKGGKVDAEWVIETPDGVATIYNYKDGKNYNGKDGYATRDITEWHIGGKTEEVVKWVVGAIQKHLTGIVK